MVMIIHDEKFLTIVFTLCNMHPPSLHILLGPKTFLA